MEIIDFKEKKRTIIPRWRDFETTLELGELRNCRAVKRAEINQEVSLDEQITDWQNNKSLSFATDLVGAGFVLGQTEGIEDALDFILSDESRATELQKKIARQAKNHTYISVPNNTESAVPNSKEIIDHSKKWVKIYREELRMSLRNPIKLVELSREHATLGHLKKALRAMDIAVSLAPANRFVLRSAVRLYVHANQVEKAHYVLRRAPSLRSDTWLLAAEIAISSSMGKTSQHIKMGMQQIEDTNYSPFELSELTSAIATLEMTNAKGKLARKLFKQSLRQPTENSIAQVEWASRTSTSFNIEIREYKAPRNYEALAMNHFKKGELESALDRGKHWILDQPFAVLPVEFTAMVAGLNEDFELGKDILSFGLRANPENITLRNNLAFTLASNNEPDLATIELERIDRTVLSEDEKIVNIATEGLIKFRKKFYNEGRVLYMRAIERAQKRSPNDKDAFRALMYLTREEIYAKTEMGLVTLENLESEARKFHPTQEVTLLLKRLKTKVTESQK
jgi:hypothetical protein